MHSPEPYFAQQPDVPQQQSPNKYLRQQKILDGSSGIKETREATRNLTSQHLANRIDNTNKEGVTFFEVHDFRY
jgi:hypothetical protein